MCGIFGYIGKRKNAPSLILNGLKLLEYRGYDSWGVAAVPISKPHKETIVIKKRIGKIGNATVDDMPDSNFAFGHTRWATHGGVTQANAHPHPDCTNKFALIHNGIIENYEELRKQLKDPHTFLSETDTEVAIHKIEEYAKRMITSKAVQKAFNEMEGLNALIILDAVHETLIAVRNGSPLVVGYGTNENFLASDAAALLPYTKQVHFLEDYQMAIVERDCIHIFDARTGEVIQPNKQLLTWDIKQTLKGHYPHFMLKEIHEQPKLVESIAGTGQSQAEKIASIVKKSYGSYMVGCGSAAYACMTGSYLFSKIAHRHMNWAIASEFGYQLDFLTKKSLVITLSQSGETIDTLDAVRKAKLKGATIVALVNVLGSSLYREADYKMLIGAGPETGVASTKAFIGKLAHLILLSFAMTGAIEKGIDMIRSAAVISETLLSEHTLTHIRKLAKLIKNKEHVYVIGRGLSYPASLETALKIKEISYIHAEGMAAGELKHGPLALVEKGIPCIAFLPNDETYGANLAGAMEMKARGGFIVGVSYKPHEVFDYYVQIDDAREATIIPNVIFAQLLAYELAVMKGYDPDKPRNLAKSVTVK